MENQVSSKSIILNYGLYYGVLSILISVIMYALGQHTEQGVVPMLLGFAIMIAFIILGIKKVKETNDGLISWGQSVKTGVGVVVIGVLISIVYQQIFINFIEPDFMAQMLEKQQQAWLDAGMTEEQIESQMGMMEKMQGPVISSAIAIVFSAFLAFVVSAIAGAIMKAEEQY